MRRFKLTTEQISFLKKEYGDSLLVKQVLSSEQKGFFEVDIDTKIDFLDFLENESVNWMNRDYEVTSKSILLESIRDDIYNQTN